MYLSDCPRENIRWAGGRRFRNGNATNLDELEGKTMNAVEDKVMRVEIPKKYELFIDGECRQSKSKERLDCFCPISGEQLTSVPIANKDDVDAAVQSGVKAFAKWSGLTAKKRQQLILKVADRICNEVDRIAWLETANTGKPMRESVANVYTAADRLRYYAGACRALEGRVLPVTSDITSYDHRVPLGVVGIIGAWNFPLNMFIGKIAPAIAAGNCVVYKPADATPLTTLEIAALMNEILPAGVVNVVTGTGPVTGEAMLSHPAIRMVSVTGSTETGRKVMRGVASTMKRVTLELGGKNAQIVFPDADLDRAAQGILLGAFLNQGQVCTSGSRIFVHRDVAQTLKDKIIALIPQLQMGDPFKEETRMGTLVSKEHFARVSDYIEIGKKQGARLLCGGRRAEVAGLPNGLFMEATLFDQVTPEMTIAREEIFGPVATIQEWSDYEQMLRDVDGVEQGLAAGIWTTSLSMAHTTAKRIQAGRIWVNCYNLFPSGASFGGVKASGFGREDAFETLFEFTEVKNVIIDSADSYRRFYG
ncbi:MAG: aldehyde dehydrogenase [Burkholderiaceae bacterium]|nr:MAG: aldehyde dehydrogenase [Burkholderiaceae bacterium]